MESQEVGRLPYGWQYPAYGEEPEDLLERVEPDGSDATVAGTELHEEQTGRHRRADAVSSEPLQAVTVEGAAAEEVYVGRHRAPDEVAEQYEAGRLERLWNTIKRNKLLVAAGTITVASMVAHPAGETIKALAETAPYVGPGMIAAEAAWIGGAAMMLAAIGKKVLNPLKIHSRFKEIPDAAANSTTFKAGLGINTAAAIAEFAIPTVAVTSSLPPESWGILAFTTVDLWATIAIRRAIWNGVKRDAPASPEASEA
jgi:hypothetical protein